MTARLHAVERVLLFGATEPAPWTLQPTATPAERFWGIVHADEQVINGVLRSWQNLDLPGEPLEIALDPPDSSSHRLVTTHPTCGGDPTSNGYHHNCYSVDEWMPPVAADGEPAYTAIWDHLLTELPPELNRSSQHRLVGVRLGARSRLPRVSSSRVFCRACC